MKKNHCNNIIDEYLDLKFMSNELFCNIGVDPRARNMAEEIKFAMNNDQRDVLEQEDMYAYMFQSLREGQLEKMQE